MALREKLNSLAAEAASRANTLAAGAASKANTAIETGKLSLKINNEEKEDRRVYPEHRRAHPGQAGRRRDP